MYCSSVDVKNRLKIPNGEEGSGALGPGVSVKGCVVTAFSDDDHLMHSVLYEREVNKAYTCYTQTLARICFTFPFPQDHYQRGCQEGFHCHQGESHWGEGLREGCHYREYMRMYLFFTIRMLSLKACVGTCILVET